MRVDGLHCMAGEEYIRVDEYERLDAVNQKLKAEVERLRKIVISRGICPDHELFREYEWDEDKGFAEMVCPTCKKSAKELLGIERGQG